MKKFLSDSTTKWITATAAVMIIVIAALSLLNLSGFTTKEPAQSVTITDLYEPSMRLYAQVQHETGIPWVLLSAVDKADKVVPDLARVQGIAKIFVQKGAIQRGLTAAPITSAADLAGLYSNNRKTIEKIVKYALELQNVYMLIQQGRYPADGGNIGDEQDGCRLTNVKEARSPFAGTIKSVSGDVVTISCDNGFTVEMDGIANPVVKEGSRMRAGDKIADVTTFFLKFSNGQTSVHPYPYLLLWMP